MWLVSRAKLYPQCQVFGGKYKGVALLLHMHFAGLGAVECELALEAVIGLGAIVVGLEIRRVAERAPTDISKLIMWILGIEP